MLAQNIRRRFYFITQVDSSFDTKMLENEVCRKIGSFFSAHQCEQKGNYNVLLVKCSCNTIDASGIIQLLTGDEGNIYVEPKDKILPEVEDRRQHFV